MVSTRRKSYDTQSSGISSNALEKEYRLFAELLTTADSTVMAQASAVQYFRRVFTENTEPPKYFDKSLIDVFIGMVGDKGQSVEMRTDAAWTLTNMLCSKRSTITHAMLDKGVLKVFDTCISAGDHKLRDQCIWGVGNIAADCFLCKSAVRKTAVLDSIAKGLQQGSFSSLESTKCAIWSVLNILRGANAPMSPVTARMLLTPVAKALRQYAGAMMQDSLLTLSLLADDRNFLQCPGAWPAQIDAMIGEEGMVAATLEAINAKIGPDGNDLVSPALRLLGNIITGTDEQTERVISRDGFVKLIGSCLDSANTQTRREAAWILSNIAAGPPQHVNLILKESEVIGQLMHRLRHDDDRLQKEICYVFANMLQSLNQEPRPALLSDLLGYGVLAIVEFATRQGTEVRLVNKIREVLSALLIKHPEFWPAVEKASAGNTPLLVAPKRRTIAPADYVIYDEDAMEI